ncbi:MAG: response regulator [Acetobacteraceae bacterium]
MTTSRPATATLRRQALVVEDEFLIAAMLKQMLAELGLPVCATADSADAAIRLAQQHLPALVLMDVRLKGSADGVDAALAIRGSVGSAIIFITGSRDPDTVRRIEEEPSFQVLFKPFLFEQLREAVGTVLSP